MSTSFPPTPSSWKTSTLGILGIVSAIAAAASALINGDYSQLSLLIPSILAGIGHIFAKDAK